MNAICTEQNTELQLERLAAMRALYSISKTAFGVHATLSTLGGLALSIAVVLCSAAKPYAFAWAGVLTVLDICWLTPWQKKLRETAATVQESFDCDLFSLPWNTLKVGRPADQELVKEHADIYRKTEPSFDSLRDWYPRDVCRLPLYLARVVCQRINAWWDGDQRRRYARCLLVAAVAMLLTMLGIGLVRKKELGDLLVDVVAPLFPGLVLALRQYKDNAEAASRLQKLKEHTEDLWRRALDGATEDHLTAQSRALQDELFDHRKRNVPVFDWLYGMLRYGHEVQMQECAARWVHELEAARGASNKAQDVLGTPRYS
jgi:hypothetical protein